MTTASTRPGIVDARSSGGWMLRVRPARDRHEQNAEVCSDATTGRLRMRTVRPVLPGDELLVWYGDERARECGVPILTPANIRGTYSSRRGIVREMVDCILHLFTCVRILCVLAKFKLFKIYSHIFFVRSTLSHLLIPM